jgi:thiamine biosynthesis lipoprotein
MLFKISFKAMGGHCEIQLAAPERETAEKSARLAINEVHRIEAKYSRYLPDSIVSRINSAAGGGDLIACDSETLWLLDYADTLYKSSNGLFDITSGVLRSAWNFKEKIIPSDDKLKSLLTLVGWDKVEGGKEGICLPIPGMEIDFGGFGKEYAADRAAAQLMSAGIQHAYINLGGDVRAIGPQPDGSPWIVGVKNPRKQDSIVATFPIERGALATSGDYEKYFELGGQRYCHVLNPFTGYPVSYWQSVSVVAPLAIVAGSYSTISMLKETTATDFLDGLGFQYFCINQEGQYTSRNVTQ